MPWCHWSLKTMNQWTIEPVVSPIWTSSESMVHWISIWGNHGFNGSMVCFETAPCFETPNNLYIQTNHIRHIRNLQHLICKAYRTVKYMSCKGKAMKCRGVWPCTHLHTYIYIYGKRGLGIRDLSSGLLGFRHGRFYSDTGELDLWSKQSLHKSPQWGLLRFSRAINKLSGG